VRDRESERERKKERENERKRERGGESWQSKIGIERE